MSSFRYSSAANADLEHIALYLFDRNPVAAHRFLDRLEGTCETLALHPMMGKQRSELGQNLRSFPIGNYLIFYTPTPHGIDVARIIHGGRDLPELFH